MDLSVNIAGIRLQNPIMPASGTFDFGEQYSKIEGFDIRRLGAVVTKATTVKPRDGNASRRLIETPSGMINFIGLANVGLAEVIKTKLPHLLQMTSCPVIVNIAGNTVEEYEELAQVLGKVPGVAALEVNISCPNVKSGGVAFGQDSVLAAEVVAATRNATDLPLIVKLTPNVASCLPVGLAVIKAGADALSLVNTFKARARIRNGPHKGEWIEGGLSGPCIRPLALRHVADLAKGLAVNQICTPIIGMGGISCLDDVLDFIESGAVAVQIGTANFIKPLLMMELIDQLANWLAENRFASFQDYLDKIRPCD